MSFQQKEREKLGQLLLDRGPDAPTLCEGWTTQDLALHLFIRENRPHAAVGSLIPALKGVTESVERQAQQQGYDAVVREWAAGPPVFLKPLDPVMNLSENFIHHEDVRRGGRTVGSIQPREFSHAVDNQLMKAVKLMGKIALKSANVPVIVTPPNHPAVTLAGRRGVSAQGDRVVRVSGAPGELLLWVSGRDVVEVDIDGNEADIAEVIRRI